MPGFRFFSLLQFLVISLFLPLLVPVLVLPSLVVGVGSFMSSDSLCFSGPRALVHEGRLPVMQNKDGESAVKAGI